jgi:hypothetical protein
MADAQYRPAQIGTWSGLQATKKGLAGEPAVLLVMLGFCRSSSLDARRNRLGTVAPSKLLSWEGTSYAGVLRVRFAKPSIRLGNGFRVNEQEGLYRLAYMSDIPTVLFKGLNLDSRYSRFQDAFPAMAASPSSPFHSPTKFSPSSRN